jgi:LPXTG-motif cell wall-anchored protein
MASGDYGPFGDQDPSFDGTVPASTGKNDSSSVWGSGVLSGLDSLTKSAGNILTGLKGNAKPKTSATPSWIYLAAGGVVLLLVVGLLFRK